MTRRLWVPVLAAVLAGALLSLTTAGPLGTGEQAQAVLEPRATVTRTITVPAGAFSAVSDDTDFYIYWERISTVTGSGTFAAPLFFEAPEVTIRKITLFARDNDTAADVCVSLLRSNPGLSGGGAQEMGRVCSQGADPEYPRSFTVSKLTYRRITPIYGPSLRVSLPGPAADDYAFFGARITYTYETGG